MISKPKYRVEPIAVGIFEVLDPDGNVIAAYEDEDVANDLVGHLNDPNRIDVAMTKESRLI